MSLDYIIGFIFYTGYYYLQLYTAEFLPDWRDGTDNFLFYGPWEVFLDSPALAAEVEVLISVLECFAVDLEDPFF